jgi:hypothetical protein
VVVEKPTFVEKIIDRPVEVIKYVDVEKIVETVRTQVIEKIVEKIVV